jgi:predicted Zn-dependent protease
MRARAISRRERHHDEKNMSARGFEISDRLLVHAAKLGAHARIVVREHAMGHVRFAASEITTAGESTSTSATLSLAFGQRHASATSNQTSEDALRTLAERVAVLARAAPEDPEYLPPLGPTRFVQNPRAWDEASAALDPIARARVARDALAHAESKSLTIAGFVQSHATASTLATSAGLRADHRATWTQMTTTARTADGTGSGWAGAQATRASEVDGAELARAACDRAERSRAPAKIDPGRYTVVLEPACVATLLAYFTEALDARAADQGRSYFSSHHAGDALFDPRVVLRSDPLDPATPGCPWDDDGISLAPTTWIESGALKSLHYTRFWAQQSGRSANGASSVWKLDSAAGEPSSDALVAKVKRGLLVTRFFYVRWLDRKQILLTGLTRDGIFLIEDGKVTRAVNNFRFNDSPLKMFGRLVGMTQQTWRAPAEDTIFRVPMIACDDFEMASGSDAV